MNLMIKGMETSTSTYLKLIKEMEDSINQVPKKLEDEYGTKYLYNLRVKSEDWYMGDMKIKERLYGRENYKVINSIATLNLIHEDFSTEQGVEQGIYNWYIVLRGYGIFLRYMCEDEGAEYNEITISEQKYFAYASKHIKMMSDIIIEILKSGVGSARGKKLVGKLDLWDISYELTELKTKMKEIGIRLSEDKYKKSMKMVHTIRKMRLSRTQVKKVRVTAGLKRGKMDKELKRILMEDDHKEIDVYEAGKTNELYKWVRPKGYILGVD